VRQQEVTLHLEYGFQLRQRLAIPTVVVVVETDVGVDREGKGVELVRGLHLTEPLVGMAGRKQVDGVPLV
jgi:hypothetical protein